MTLEEIYAPAAAEMQRVEEILSLELSAHSENIEQLLEHVASFRGKRMRPAIAILAGKATGRATEVHSYIGAVVELIHTATLIHDDIIDDAELRRGLPTVHATWGTEISVLLGDYILSRAFSVISQFDGTECLPHITRTTNIMCEGELVQLQARFDLDLDEETYLKIAECKTASLCALCAKLGATFAGADEGDIQSLHDFGIKLGLAFQITDDCLDITGDEGVVGKSLGTDLLQGKLTLPAIRLLAELSREERSEVARMFEDGFPGQARPRFRELAGQYGAVESSLETARQLIEDANGCLSGLPDSPSRRSLEALADYVVCRDL